MTTSDQETLWTAKKKAWFAGLMLAWFAGAYVIGTEQFLTNDGHSVFAPIAISAFLPVALFFAAYGLVPGFATSCWPRTFAP